MADDINVLKGLGVQKIHNDTHISKEHVQEILNETFNGLNAVQFAGFISILQREYGIDLSELKSKGVACLSETKINSIENAKVFIPQKKQKYNVYLYALIGVLIFASFIYYKLTYLDSNSSNIEKVDNTKIQKVVKNIKPTLEIKNSVIAIDSNKTRSSDSLAKNSFESKKMMGDSNITEDKNITIKKPLEEVKEEIRTLKVLPVNKVWVGYINIKTNQKYQKIFRKKHSLDTTKDWLLLFGAGNIKLEVNGEIKRYESEDYMRFKYVDGEFTKIGVTEFKSLNKGRKW